jgi:pyrroline-5-carboxylate reductase
VVEERLIDAITAVSGSGPAYVYYLAEAMERAAGELGLGEHARLLVSQTILGAAQLLVQSPDAAAELRRKVTSPGGTTEAALKVMESRQVGDAIVAAVHAAEARGRELGA